MSIFKRLVTGTVNRFSGRTDLLEATVAGCALVASADGNASDEEIGTTLNALAANPTIAAAFDQRTIESTVEAMFKRANAGRVGRMGLYKEIDDVASNADHAEVVLFSVVDVADDDGIQDSELAVIKTIAQRLKLDYTRFLA